MEFLTYLLLFLAFFLLVFLLAGFLFLDEETLKEVVEELMTTEGWPLYKVLAHLDMIDHDERT